jgi:hypothetical protein
MFVYNPGVPLWFFAGLIFVSPAKQLFLVSDFCNLAEGIQYCMPAFFFCNGKCPLRSMHPAAIPFTTST